MEIVENISLFCVFANSKLLHFEEAVHEEYIETQNQVEHFPQVLQI